MLMALSAGFYITIIVYAVRYDSQIVHQLGCHLPGE